MTDREGKIDELLTRGVAEVINVDHLRARLIANEPLRVKFGIDPTSPNIHVGRAVPLLKLRDFQELGHTVVFIIGDFTGQIGDTSDKESERPMLSEAVVGENLKTYLDQAGKILDISKIEVHRNSEWLSGLGYAEIGREADAFSLAEFIARENIRKRLDEGKRISLRELLYPLMQGHDSVEVSADVEIGGIDQRFNLLAGRKLLVQAGRIPQDILMNNLLLGTDGRKMSSSWGNTINIHDNASDMFGKVMSIPDDNIIPYLVHATRISMEEIAQLDAAMKSGAMNPRDAKARLARDIVERYHGVEPSRAADEHFVSIFSRRESPDDIREIHLAADMNLLDFLVQEGFAGSRAEARRKVEQGGIEINGKKILDREFVLMKNGDNVTLRSGKRDFVRIVSE